MRRFKMSQLNPDLVHKWLIANTVDKNGGAKITGQTPNAFLQSVKLGYIKPYYDNGEKGAASIRLYLKSDLEEYARIKRN